MEEIKKPLESELIAKIDNILHTSTPSRRVFERLLGEYLHFLKLDHGALMLCVNFRPLTVAKYTAGHFVAPYEWWILHQHTHCEYLTQNRHSIHTLTDVEISWLNQKNKTEWIQGAVTLIPIADDKEALGVIALVPPKGYSVDENKLKVGQVIGVHIANWLKQQKRIEKSKQLAIITQKVARISELIKSISDQDELINTSIHLIRDELNYYYVSVFFIDDEQKYATLQAGTGKAGQIMIGQQRSRIPINEDTVLGWVLQNRKPRIALDVGEGAVRFVNPRVPETHSEIVLPLGKDQLMGALDIQSFEKDAFSDEDIPLLQSIADELAIAIQNVHKLGI